MSWGSNMLSRCPVPVTVMIPGKLSPGTNDEVSFFRVDTRHPVQFRFTVHSSRSCFPWNPARSRTRRTTIIATIIGGNHFREGVHGTKETWRETRVVVGSGVGRCCTSATRGAPRARRQREHRWWPPTRSTGVVVVCRFPKSRLQQRQGHVERARSRHAPCRPSPLGTAPRAPSHGPLTPFRPAPRIFHPALVI